MSRWFGALLVVAMASGGANADGRSAAIPVGIDWYCFRLSSPATHSISACHRTEEACTQHRGTITDDGVTEISECQHQVKAAVVTYFDVMKDRWSAWAASSTEECGQARRYLSESQDNKQISSCQLVGAVYPPPAAFQPRAVPTGRDWFCMTDGDHVCSRSSCVEGQPCARQAKASVFTSTDSGTASASAYRSTADCELVRHNMLFAVDDVSACTIVGATSPAVPPGSGWYCYSVGTDPNEGNCRRTSDACERARSYDEHSRNLSPTKCTRAEAAFAYAIDDKYEVVSTEERCTLRMNVRGVDSRCERLK